MQGRFRRLGAALVAMAAAATVVATAGPADAAACTGPRTVSIVGGRVVEGSTRGTFTIANFTVTTTGCTQAGTVRFSTVAYTAGKTDFVAKTASVAWRAGETGSKTVPVQVIQDLVPEVVKCFSGQLSVPTTDVRIAAGADQAAMIIVDDDLTAAGGGFHCSE